MHRGNACLFRRHQVPGGATAPRDHTITTDRCGHSRNVGNGVRPHGRYADFQFRYACRHQRPGDRQAIHPVYDNAGGLFTIAERCIDEMETAHLALSYAPAEMAPEGQPLSQAAQSTHFSASIM